MKNKFKFSLMLIAVALLHATSYACVGSDHSCVTECGTTASHLHVIDFDDAITEAVTTATTETEALASDLNSSVEANSILDKASLVARDNTQIASVAGVWGFFAGALKSVAVWGGVRLTKWVMNRIRKRARTYEYYYNAGDSGVVKAAHHWSDLQRRSSCGREPDHNLRKVGFQGGEECPICSKQLNDLKGK